ncbi:hypothetical protein LWI29_004483 [Acer saccharum]|uniref:Uncharacterized protein n=1 Tax=Acer saccharum TaxID=4024 RepID=A0AA39RBD8_ACESA|nr:hypothetical protein LWI29_004483 [Acer saccharum]
MRQSAVSIGGRWPPITTAELLPAKQGRNGGSIRRSAATQPPIQPPKSNGGFIRRPGRRSRPPITNRGENQGDAKCISIGGLRAKPSTF